MPEMRRVENLRFLGEDTMNDSLNVAGPGDRSREWYLCLDDDTRFYVEFLAVKKGVGDPL
ncbi:MAG: hypothetical protein MAG715_01138 [Methanonatronarchaeales archaeon]|nr:hypothetical protein [Methanonatronarchaeales archaeon]